MAYIDSNATFRANLARRLTIHNVRKAVQHNVSLGNSIGIPDTLLGHIAEDSLPPLPPPPVLHETTDAIIKIGIIGAGAAGLFAGMIIDFLKRSVPDLNIDYQILEATDGTRLGYYDVGAMRFPKNPVMKRTFELFWELGMIEHPNPGPNPPIGCLIPYYFKGENTPWLFNDPSYIGYEPWSAGPNTFDLTDDIPFLDKDPSKVLDTVIDHFKQLLKEDIDKKKKIDREEKAKEKPELKVQTHADEKDGYSFDTVQWLETFNGGTHWYNQAFSETVLEAMDFDYPTAKSPQIPSEKIDWWCVNGGASEIAKRMTNRLKSKPIYNCPVAKISETADNRQLTVSLQTGDPLGTFDAVLDSTTLGAMQRMDLTEVNLNYGTKQATRTLTYGASCKVGIQFDRPWWISDFKITKGGLGRTDLPIRTCVYPSYNLHDDQNSRAVLLCTYTWEGDAQRMGSMIDRNSPDRDLPALRTLLLRDLALLHSTPDTYNDVLGKISSSYITHYAGAFAFFGPGQFAGMWPDIVNPSSDGKLVIIGEHASAHHAWIVGALESAVRGVWQVIHRYSGSIINSDKAMQLLDSESSTPFGPLPLESPSVLMQ